MGVKTHLSSYPARGARRAHARRHAAGNGRRLRDPRRRRLRNKPIAITKVVFPDGHVDTSWGRPHRVKVLSEGVTAEETKILHQNVQGGTATSSAIDCPTAAKTGTTSELIDAWLDGYNADYSTVVWMGYPNRRVSMTDVHGEPQQGGYLPADIWHDYMAPVTEGEPCAPLHESKDRSPTSRSTATSPPPGAPPANSSAPNPPNRAPRQIPERTPRNAGDPDPKRPAHPRAREAEPQAGEPGARATPEARAPAPTPTPPPAGEPAGGCRTPHLSGPSRRALARDAGRLSAWRRKTRSNSRAR